MSDLERQLRLRRFEELGGLAGFAKGVATSEVNRNADGGIRVFYGGRGIWYDAARTRKLALPGVTVGVLHTGRHYADDLAPDCIEYHYPETDVPGKDAAEIAATKNAMELSLPVLVVVQRGPLRDVYLGWVDDANDETGSFLIVFAAKQPASISLEEIEDQPFETHTNKPTQRSEVNRRERDPGFAHRVKARYGVACAVCRLSVPGLLDAAHIIPVRDGGTNDPRNGLPLCPTHHRAFDNGLFGIEPSDLIVVPLSGNTLEELAIKEESIKWLRTAPHEAALAWRWDRQSSEGMP